MRRLTRAHAGLILAILAVAFLPMIGALPRWGGLPPEFGTFPPHVSGSPKPPFHALYFSVGVACALAVLAFLLMPAVFGFRVRGTRRRLAQGHLPWWFWLGLFVNAVSWVIHWWGPVSLARFTFLPLWWGMIVAVDGVVYARASGRSLLATEPKRMAVIALVSMPAWAFFEFLNYYAVEFWVYPSNQVFSPFGQAIWFILSFSVVLPGIFEWYTLLHTIDGCWNRWSHGPELTVPTRYLGLVLAVGAVALALFGAFPFELFWLLWVGPPIILTVALVMLGFWTPFRPITHGNWSPVVLAGISSVINGFFWELWNYGSAFFHGGFETNPNYWNYEIPYVENIHLFSEMPLLGYFGYLPFGFLAWVCWLVAAHLLDYEPRFNLTRCRPDQEEMH
jgi:hypothetical protein